MCGGSSGSGYQPPPPAPIIETKIAERPDYESWKGVRSEERQRRIAMLNDQGLTPNPFASTQDPSSDRTRTTLLGS